MKVSKFAAHYMLSPDGIFVKWPVVTIREDGMVLKTEAFPDGLREQAGIIFFSGILCPAFIDIGGSNDYDLLNNDKHLLNRHYSDGTLFLGISEPAEFLVNRQKFPLVIPIENKNDESFPLFDSETLAETLLSRMKSIFLRTDNTGNLEALLMSATQFAAMAMGISMAGKLEPGFVPGLLLLQDADIFNFKLTSQTSVKWLNIPDPKYYYE